MATQERFPRAAAGSSDFANLMHPIHRGKAPSPYRTSSSSIALGPGPEFPPALLLARPVR